MSILLSVFGDDDHVNIPHPSATLIHPNIPISGYLDPDDNDYFQVRTPQTGQVRAYTTGPTETRTYFRGINIDGDWRLVNPGMYYVSVQNAYTENGSVIIGPYTLHVEFTASGEIPNPPVVRGDFEQPC